MDGARKGVAIVTGASSGIGAVYADRLARRGQDLMLVARRRPRLEEIAARIRSTAAVSVEIMVADLRRASGCAAVERLLAERDDVTILINNAGIGAFGPADRVSVEALDALVKVNVLALTRLSHAALVAFGRRKRGTIVNIASIGAFRPNAGLATYLASKAYVLHFTRSIEIEADGKPIKIQVVLPGPILTEFFEAAGADPSIFPDESFMAPETLVDAALEDLDRGQLVSIPTLPNMADWDKLNAVQLKLLDSCGRGEPAARYRFARQ